MLSKCIKNLKLLKSSELQTKEVVQVKKKKKNKGDQTFLFQVVSTPLLLNRNP